jgi:hypothetical protein
MRTSAVSSEPWPADGRNWPRVRARTLRHGRPRSRSRSRRVPNRAPLAASAFISPFRRERDIARELAGTENVLEVFVSTPLKYCEQSDVKGFVPKTARRNDSEHYRKSTARTRRPTHRNSSSVWRPSARWCIRSWISSRAIGGLYVRDTGLWASGASSLPYNDRCSPLVSL